MSIVDTYKSEFKIFVYDEDLIRSEKLSEELKRASYNATCFNSRGLFQEAIEQELPHVFILYYQPLSMKFRELLTKIRKQSDEVEIILLGADQFWPGISNLIKNGTVDDFWSWPAAGREALYLRLNKVIERNIFKFIAEQRSEETRTIVENLDKLEETGFEAQSPVRADGEGLLEMIGPHTNSEVKMMEQFMDRLKELYPNSDFVYLRNYPAREQLLIARTSFATEKYFRGQALAFDQERLKEEKGEVLNTLRTQLEESFDCEDFILQPLEMAGDFYGFVMAINFQDQSFLQKSSKYASIGLRNIRLETSEIKPDIDKELDLEVPRTQFPLALSKEISRSRRLKLPVSLIVTHVEFVAMEEKERQAALELIRNNLRSYDFMCALDDEKIAIVLPHCQYEDAAIKAETIRRQLVARGLKTQNTPLRLCFGVSEFPALSQDSDSLIVDAQKACAQVLVSGKNKVCLYTATQGFEPEFQPRELT